MASYGSSIPQPIHSRKPLKLRLRNGEKLYGLFFRSFSPDLAEIAALAGYDFVIIDMEHGAGGIPEALSCIRALGSTGCAAVVRVPEISEAWAKKALDLGVDGIMFPMVESGRSASEAVSFCRYPPHGVRGNAVGLVRDSKFGFDKAYLANFADKLFVMAQIESEEGVKNAKEIVAVDGVDCVMIGPRDLSASLGFIHDQSNPKVKSAMKTVEKAVLASEPANGGAYLAGIATPQNKVVDLRARGYQVVLGSADLNLFQKAVVDDVNNFKLRSLL
ncbi:unnamed protein product [Microthlaspi erraticum]|uniref:HpcH/HpaI aldolase/citrate lyase domain-containing protein n=1 Tax=Microthlaspi erraticum TaxID=1685480 RepID=A0A6D2JCE8_9BRAS|nr:unnamed protein product [Microthlaspi erraticum]